MDIGTQEFIHTARPSPDKMDPIENWNPHSTVTDLSLHNKPKGGLWTSPVDADWRWSDWCEKKDWNTGDESVYRLEPDNDVSIYTINSLQALRLLHRDYGYDPHTAGYGNTVLDFEQIFEDFDAIYVTERGEDETRFSDPNLYGWDVECILWSEWSFTSVDKVNEPA
jgi:hypothetical protein